MKKRKKISFYNLFRKEAFCLSRGYNLDVVEEESIETRDMYDLRDTVSVWRRHGTQLSPGIPRPSNLGPCPISRILEFWVPVPVPDPRFADHGSRSQSWIFCSIPDPGYESRFLSFQSRTQSKISQILNWSPDASLDFKRSPGPGSRFPGCLVPDADPCIIDNL